MLVQRFEAVGNSRSWECNSSLQRIHYFRVPCHYINMKPHHYLKPDHMRSASTYSLLCCYGNTPFRRRRFIATFSLLSISSRGHFVASHFVARTLSHQLFRRRDTLLPVILSLGLFATRRFVTGTLRRRKTRMTKKHFNLYIGTWMSIIYGSIIYMYVFNCIYYLLEFILTALFIHTVSVTCIYTYRILKYMYYYTTRNVFAFIGNLLQKWRIIHYLA